MKIRHPMDLRHSVCVSYVKHMRKSLCAYTLDKSLSQKRPTKETCILQKRPIILRSLHVSRVTHMNTSHVARTNESHVARTNESCPTSKFSGEKCMNSTTHTNETWHSQILSTWVSHGYD